MKYKAMINIMGGGTWYTADTKEEAVEKCVALCIRDWSSLFDIKAAKKAGELRVNIYQDMGTDSHEDDVYLETVIA